MVGLRDLAITGQAEFVGPLHFDCVSVLFGLGEGVVVAAIREPMDDVLICSLSRCLTGCLLLRLLWLRVIDAEVDQGG